MLPAPCQGAVGIECRHDDTKILSLLKPLDDHKTHSAIEAERAFLMRIGGGCQVPIAALARIIDERTLQINGLVASIDGTNSITQKIEGSISDNKKLGITLAENILGKGGDKILDELKNTLL